MADDPITLNGAPRGGSDTSRPGGTAGGGAGPAAPVGAGSLALLLAIGIFWGINWPAVRIILGEIPPWTLRTIGFTSGALLLFAIARLRGETLLPRAAELPRLTLAGLLTVFGFNALTAYGQLHTEASRAAIIAFTMPLWATLMSAVILGERLTIERVLALLAGLTGLSLLLGQDLLEVGRSPLGAILVLGAALSWAAGTVVLKGATWSLAPLATAAWLIAVSAPPVILLSLLFDRPWELTVSSPQVWVALAYHIALPMVFCHTAWVTIVARLAAPVAAIGTLLIPVVGVLSSALLVGEALTLRKIGALLLIVCAVALVLIVPALRRRRERP